MVYLLFDPITALYKIGFTHQGITTRLRQLRREFPGITCIHSFIGGYKQEKKVHSLFECRRVKSEWFQLTDADVELFKSLSNEKLATI